MIPPFFSIIAEAPTCQQYLGKEPKMRFFSFGEARQNTELPYAVWQMPTSVPANYLGQLPDTDDARVQIDVYASTQENALLVARAIRDALEPHAHMTLASMRSRDSVTRSHGFMLEFEFFTPR
jgi:hypothetical protein